VLPLSRVRRAAGPDLLQQAVRSSTDAETTGRLAFLWGAYLTASLT
jgi:hypothetical protein